MPNGLGAILAALAGGAEGYTNLKQREREEALEAERRAREEQDRQEQKAFQQFEMERELRKMGGRYTDEMGPGTLNPDAPSLVKMDRVEAALLGTANALPPRADGTPRGPLKIGLTPNAANIGIDLDKERVRMASQAIEVPGSGGKSGITRRVYLPTANELGDQAFARKQREGKTEYETKLNQDKIERETIYNENMARGNAEWARTAKGLSAYGLTDKQIAGYQFGIKSLSPDQQSAADIAIRKMKSDEGQTKIQAMTDFTRSYREYNNGNSPSSEQVLYFIRSLQSAQDGGKFLMGLPPDEKSGNRRWLRNFP